VSEKSLELTRALLLILSQTLTIVDRVGSTNMASLASFSHGGGSTDLVSELPIWPHCWVSGKALSSTDTVSVVPRIPD
jgi:hypothetical protein